MGLPSLSLPSQYAAAASMSIWMIVAHGRVCARTMSRTAMAKPQILHCVQDDTALEYDCVQDDTALEYDFVQDDTALEYDIFQDDTALEYDFVHQDTAFEYDCVQDDTALEYG